MYTGSFKQIPFGTFAVSLTRCCWVFQFRLNSVWSAFVKSNFAKQCIQPDDEAGQGGGVCKRKLIYSRPLLHTANLRRTQSEGRPFLREEYFRKKNDVNRDEMFLIINRLLT